MLSNLRIFASGRSHVSVLALMVALAAAAAPRSAAPKFLPDDPIQVDDDRALDAGKAEPIEGSNAYDFAEHTFLKSGERRNVRAVNVNTIDEVPDSSWFTNRIGHAATCRWTSSCAGQIVSIAWRSKGGRSWRARAAA